MNFETNKEEFDFPCWDGIPKSSYVLLSTPRSGSNMLVRALWQSGVAGAPEEYLTAAFIDDFSTRFGSRHRNLAGERLWKVHDEVASGTLTSYVQNLVRYRTSPNGVFGIKMHASHFFLEHLRLVDLRRALPVDRLIRIRRLNYTKQAISLILAHETDQWIDDPEWKSVSKPLTKSSRDVEFDRDRILDNIEYLHALDQFLDELVAEWNLPVKEVIYEELCDDFEHVLRYLFDFIGVSVKVRTPVVNIRQQLDHTKDVWYERFLQAS